MSDAHARPAPRAVVFAYHDVGVRCLRVLLDAGVDVALVVTHEDARDETIWFGSVSAVALEAGIDCVTPEDPHEAPLLARAQAIAPDFVFSFYYRRMLDARWLDLPARGAFNMHGSLLPRYRGRAPVNWALIHGERETGATLHRMTLKPDSGAVLDQCAVPVLREDTAREVFTKVVVAAEVVLARTLPKLVDGTAVERPQVLSQGSYFGGRRPEDGRIPSDAGAVRIHNLVRALAPPFPAAFLPIHGGRLYLDRTRLATRSPVAHASGPRLWSNGVRMFLDAADGGTLEILAARVVRGQGVQHIDAAGLLGIVGPAGLSLA